MVLALTASILVAQLDPAQIARIEADQKDAVQAVDAKYGNKKSSELSQDERRGYIQERAAAEQGVLEKHGVDGKVWARTNAKLSKDDREAVKAETKKLEAAAAQAKKPGGPKEIRVQKGGPVVLEEREGVPGTVEQGLTPDDEADEEAANALDKGDGPSGGPRETPSKPSGKKRR